MSRHAPDCPMSDDCPNGHDGVRECSRCARQCSAQCAVNEDRPADLAHDKGRCEVCGQEFDAPVTLGTILDHLRENHPDEYGEGLATWPDGEVVVFDETLDPEDFLNGKHP